jgi:hypothetical protein
MAMAQEVTLLYHRLLQAFSLFKLFTGANAWAVLGAVCSTSKPFLHMCRGVETKLALQVEVEMSYDLQSRTKRTGDDDLR